MGGEKENKFGGGGVGGMSCVQRLLFLHWPKCASIIWAVSEGMLLLCARLDL